MSGVVSILNSRNCDNLKLDNKTYYNHAPSHFEWMKLLLDIDDNIRLISNGSFVLQLKVKLGQQNLT
jgi:hypothetical protein